MDSALQKLMNFDYIPLRWTSVFKHCQKCISSSDNSYCLSNMDTTGPIPKSLLVQNVQWL